MKSKGTKSIWKRNSHKVISLNILEESWNTKSESFWKLDFDGKPYSVMHLKSTSVAFFSHSDLRKSSPSLKVLMRFDWPIWRHGTWASDSWTGSISLSLGSQCSSNECLFWSTINEILTYPNSSYTQSNPLTSYLN